MELFVWVGVAIVVVISGIGVLDLLAACRS